MPTIQEMIEVVFREGIPQDLKNTALVFSQETVPIDEIKPFLPVEEGV